MKTPISRAVATAMTQTSHDAYWLGHFRPQQVSWRCEDDSADGCTHYLATCPLCGYTMEVIVDTNRDVHTSVPLEWCRR